MSADISKAVADAISTTATAAADIEIAVVIKLKIITRGDGATVL